MNDPLCACPTISKEEIKDTDIHKLCGGKVQQDILDKLVSIKTKKVKKGVTN